MNCPKCFQPLRPGQPFCSNCGAKIEKNDVNPNAEQPTVWQPPAQQEQPTVWQPPVQQEQPSTWQPPAQQEQPSTWQPPAQQEQPTAWQPPAQQNRPGAWQSPTQQRQPAAKQSSPDFAQQFQQYSQPSQAGGTRKGNGSLPPEKNTLPLIIIVIVAAVLLIGGGVVAAIMIFGGNPKPPAETKSRVASSETGGDSSNPVFDISSIIGDLQSSGTESSDTESSYYSSSRTESGRTESSRTESGRTESSGTESGRTTTADHSIVNEEGVVLAVDDSIDANDTATQNKLDAFIVASDTPTEVSSGVLEGKVYAQGNALVYEFAFITELTEEQEETLQDTADGLKEKASTYLKQLRLVADSPDAVMVYAYLSVDGRVLAGSVCDE